MHFAYYENVDFLESESCCNVRDSDIEEARYQTSFIEDWENFDAFDQVLCFYIGMDGNIYRINSPDPIPLWRRKDYIGSFANDEYSLPEVVKVLEKRKWIKNIEIIDIPYYNQEEGKTRAIEFEYKLPSKKDLGKKLSKNKLFANHYFG